MRSHVYDPTAPKKPTNLSINSDLLQQARALKINLSRTLEECLASLLREEQRRRWREQNRDGIELYNKRVETGGVFSDTVRRF